MRKELLPPNDDDEVELRKRLLESFRKIDKDGSGDLSFKEVRDALDEAELPTTKRQVRRLFDAADLNGDGKIDFEEFAAFACRRRQALRGAFESMLNDSRHHDDGTGGSAVITARHLRVASSKAGLPLSDKDVREIMGRIHDETTSGKNNQNRGFTFEEFVRYSMIIPAVNPHAYFDEFFREAWTDSTGAVSEFAVATEADLPDDSAVNETFAKAAARKIACGGIAGVMSRTMTAPIDRLRILMMTATDGPVGFSRALSLATNSPPGIGLRGFWMGNGLNCTKIAPEMGIKLFTFELLRDCVSADPSDPTTVERFVAGGAAGAIAEATVYPLDVLKTRMATGRYGSFADCFSSVLASGRGGGGGIGSFYAGLAPSLAGIVPFAAIDLTVNSHLKDAAAAWYLERAAESGGDDDGEIGVAALLSCGMASSATAAVATFPLNVIRTVAQATGRPAAEVVLDLRREGFRRFYRGLIPSLLKVMPATSISYTSYEWLKKRW